MIPRRGFLGAILAAGVAPAFVRARVLMPVRTLIVPSGPLSYYGSIVSRPDDVTLPYSLGSLWKNTTTDEQFILIGYGWQRIGRGGRWGVPDSAWTRGGAPPWPPVAGRRT